MRSPMKKGSVSIISCPRIPQEEYSLTVRQIEVAKNLFQTLDKFQYGFIQAEDLIYYLTQCGLRLTKYQVIDMLDECGCSTTGIIRLPSFLAIISRHKRILEKQRKDSTLDAFLSVGGTLEQGSSIDTDQLIRIVKDEFQMTIDLENMVKEIDVDRSGKIDFQEFCSLFSG